jgi:hypothetical protein
LDLFQKHHGLFRLTERDQLYQLYETENYNYDYPSRPYIVTTDIFWELFGGAYLGVFVLNEREKAIPDFWSFINKATDYFIANHKESKWNIVFEVLKNYRNNNTTNEEAARIIAGEDNITAVTGNRYAYSDLKARGHYTSSPEMEQYFKAFRYFTTVLSEFKFQDDMMELDNLPSEIKQYAANWINAYSSFIAPSRGALVWKNMETAIPKYCQYPKEEKAIFPLSWGFDNEIFNSTVFHRSFPEPLQIKGPMDDKGFTAKRMVPSGLDIASVLGNGLADKLLADDYKAYPPLRKVIDNLRSNYKTHSNTPDFKGNLYNQWMNVMALQWADGVHPATETKGDEIWKVKRLQTGLATWATLRHATVLVNDRVGAEMGSGGGFEDILMKPPRGCVEADPATFKAIAGLFEELLVSVSKIKPNDTKIPDVYAGVVERLKEAKEETLLFTAIAEKERNGEKPTNDEYEKIRYVARVAEHLFLVFNSLINPDNGLSEPDPMGKIADVSQVEWASTPATQGVHSYFMVAVGNPMEWNYIVPYYGRYQLVKGSIYSYYEFESTEVLNDEEWRQKINTQELLPWIKPYVTTRTTLNETGY